MIPKIPKHYKYEILQAKDRAQIRANRENRPFHVVISKKRFVQIGKSSNHPDPNWIFLFNIKPKAQK